MPVESYEQVKAQRDLLLDAAKSVVSWLYSKIEIDAERGKIAIDRLQSTIDKVERENA